jgi:hypothetical protein
MLWNRPQSSTGTSPQTGQNGSETGCGEWIEMNELQFRHRHSVACNDGFIALSVQNVVFSSMLVSSITKSIIRSSVNLKTVTSYSYKRAYKA